MFHPERGEEKPALWCSYFASSIREVGRYVFAKVTWKASACVSLKLRPTPPTVAAFQFTTPNLESRTAPPLDKAVSCNANKGDHAYTGPPVKPRTFSSVCAW